jgi:excisionase family DNA binding protein
MEKLLLTMWEAADVLGVGRSRAYELLYAEQLDSVKIGRSRRVALASVGRLESRRTVKRRTLESDRGAWRNYIAPRFGHRPVASITTADVSSWLGDLMRRGLARPTVTRGLATLRSLLSFAVADGRVTVNAAAVAKAPTGGQARREGRFLDLDEVVALAQACRSESGSASTGARRSCHDDGPVRAHDRPNLGDAAQRLGGTTGARPDEGPEDEGGALPESRR